MKCVSIAVGLIVCPLLLFGCSQEEIPTIHLSEVTVTAEGEAVSFAWDEAPKLIRIVKPQYPEIAREDGVEGKVVLTMVIDKEGKVAEAKVLLAEPAEVFNEAALNAVLQYEFEPAKKDGKQIKVQVGHSILFTLASRKPL